MLAMELDELSHIRSTVDQAPMCEENIIDDEDPGTDEMVELAFEIARRRAQSRVTNNQVPESGGREAILHTCTEQ